MGGCESCQDSNLNVLHKITGPFADNQVQRMECLCGDGP